MKNFSNFTNLYELSKTLRFELKPIWKTKELLEWEDIFPRDRKIEEIYQNIIKPCLNNLHSELIEESLKWASLNLDENDYIIWKWAVNRHWNENEKKKFKDNFDKKKKELRKQVVAYLTNSTIKDKYSKISGWKDLTDKKILPILAEIYWDKIYEEDTQDKKKKYENSDLLWKTYKELINEYFIWFFTYLWNFNKNRENLYKDDWKASRVATRLIDENLIKFFQNKLSYEKFAWVIDLAAEQQNCFDTLCYQNYLNQKWIDNYNKLIWEINSEINKHNQIHWTKLPKLIELYKQILAKSDKENGFSFVDSIIEDDKYLEEQLKIFLWDSKNRIENANKSVFEKLLECDDIELEKIYFKTSTLKDISNKYLENRSVLGSLLPEDEEWKKKKWKKQPDIASLLEIKTLLETVDTEGFVKLNFVENNNITFKSNLAFWQLLECLLFDAKLLESEFNLYSELLDEKLFSWDFSKNLRNKEKNIEIDWIFMTWKTLIKETIEKVLNFEQMLRYFSLEKGQWESKERIDVEFDSDFYGNIDKFYENDFRPHKFFNAVRNYLTKKQYSTDKFKLNFDNSTFLDWRDKNKESDNFGVILRKDWKYFLAIMKKWENKLFKNTNKELYDVNWDCFEKLEYKLLPWPNKMLPKVFFSNKSIEFFWPSADVLRIRKDETFKQWDKFSLKDLHSWIDFMKKSLEKHEDWSKFWFSFKETNDYKQINEFYADVEKQWYKISFSKVNLEVLKKYVEEWKLYLFQIYNKDFSESHKWNENLHTKYWKALFEKENFEDGACFKLNWKAEIFFRPATIKDKKIKNLNIKNDWAIENKRFTEPKIMFHCPITMNFVNKKEFKINDMVKEYAKTNKMNVIWIDRWEKHLLYYALIDQEWNILKQWDELQLCTMNELTAFLPGWKTKKTINYYEKLVSKEWNREKERVDWNEIENIKEMKKWYLSHVVHKIVELAVENNAIIVLEDLNSGFKNSRKKVERQIYQNFELALAKKLNFVVDKKKSDTELWWLYHAYQLAPQVSDFQDIRNQTWILFYTQAGYTSTTCPVCWYRKNVYRKYESVEKTKQFFKDFNLKIQKIWSDYYFDYIIEAIADKYWNKREKLDRKLTTKDQNRLYNQRIEKSKAFESIEVNLSVRFNGLFEKYWIDQNNIINSMIEKSDTQLFKDFMFYRNLLLQIRNSKEWDEWWYIQCPSCWFHSENWFQWADFNGDANGAYNIARKWIKILEKIQYWEEKLGITNVEWDNFSQLKK